jgi:hyperosmotically inducible protein
MFIVHEAGLPPQRHPARAAARGLAVLALLVLSFATPRVAAAQISDSDLAERAVDAINRYSQFSIFDDVNLSVSDRTIRLTGRVTAPNKKDDIGRLVGKIDGVRSLVNDIQVLPLSRGDAELRMRVAQQIYNHPSFWRYASMAQPPIHIIVENGHITLTGRVDSQVDKSLAFALAQVPGAFDVRNDLRVDR